MIYKPLQRAVFSRKHETFEANEIGEKHGALLMEDAAEAMGAIINGKQCGSFGVHFIAVSGELFDKFLRLHIMYAKYFKRIIDFVVSLMALVVLSPILLILVVLGAWKMKGNPFFTQERPGKDEKIFKLIKFRSMTCERDKDGRLLPDAVRLTRYGRILRSTSLDELPELLNILKGDMSLVGPRPLLVEYLPYYTEKERHRHDIRPGLTGWAQVNGRNTIDWEKRFQYDVEYVKNVSFAFDIKVLGFTIMTVLKRTGVHENTQVTEGNFAEIRRKELETKNSWNL